MNLFFFKNKLFILNYHMANRISYENKNIFNIFYPTKKKFAKKKFFFYLENKMNILKNILKK